MLKDKKTISIRQINTLKTQKNLQRWAESKREIKWLELSFFP